MFATGYLMMLRFLFTQNGDESGSGSAKILALQVCDVKRERSNVGSPVSRFMAPVVAQRKGER